MKIRNIRAIAGKEFLHLTRDFRSLYLAFIIPLILILLFGYALSLDVKNIKTVVLDQDHTPMSRNFINKLGASKYFDVLGEIENSGDINGYLDTSKASLAIVIPPRFSQKIKSDNASPIQAILDGADPNFANITRGYVNAFTEGYNQKLLVDYLNKNGMTEIKTPVDAKVRVWFNEDLESRNFIIPGITAIIIIIAGALLTALVIAREYENGTMETIKSIPITSGEFLLGKAIPYFVIGMADVLIAVLLAQLLFGIVMKSSFWLMILASSIYLCNALAIGLLISIVTKSQLAANQAAILITYLPSFLLSNFVFPLTNMPKVLQSISYILPATYYIDILSGIYMRGVGLQYLMKDLIVLTVMLGILSTLSYLILSRREGM